MELGADGVLMNTAIASRGRRTDGGSMLTRSSAAAKHSLQGACQKNFTLPRRLPTGVVR